MVDLKGFEPLTSSMPFKKYQSLTGRNTRNRRLTVTRFGRRWTPRRAFFRVWTPRGLQDSTPGTEQRVPSHARLQAVVIVVCWRRQHVVSLIRTMPDCGVWTTEKNAAAAISSGYPGFLLAAVSLFGSCTIGGGTEGGGVGEVFVSLPSRVDCSPPSTDGGGVDGGAAVKIASPAISRAPSSGRPSIILPSVPASFPSSCLFCASLLVATAGAGF